jgi:adenine-specific DNA-methyltransferase
MFKYPTVNYIGNKEKIANWICDQFPKECNSVFDAFSGGCSVSYEAKKRNLRVITNDILKINYHLGNALIQNKKIILCDKDVELIFSGKPLKGFMFKNFSNVFFFPEECMELDLYRKNIEKLDCEFKKSLAFSLIRRSMIRKMPYSRFNINWEKIVQLRDEAYSYKKYKRKRSYHNQSFRHHFIHNLEAYNQSIFDNKKKNISYNDDIFNLLKTVKSDIIYLDPPYTGTMNNYFGFYGLIDSYISSTIKEPFKNNFIDKKTTIELFDKLFSNLGNFKYWMMSYNNTSTPTKEQLLALFGKYSDDIKIIERKHNYKVTGKGKKDMNKEYLFIVKNTKLFAKSKK